jgi:hypothetical protein
MNNGKKVKVCYIRSKSFIELKKYRDMFYMNSEYGNKCLKSGILDLLEPLGLAVWYMDDGSYNYRNRISSICSFVCDLRYLNKIKNYFNKRWGIECRINKTNPGSFSSFKGKRHRIDFTVQSTDKFLRLIEPFIPFCMDYKLGHVKNKNLKRILRLEEDKRKKYRLYNKKRSAKK